MGLHAFRATMSREWFDGFEQWCWPDGHPQRFSRLGSGADKADGEKTDSEVAQHGGNCGPRCPKDPAAKAAFCEIYAASFGVIFTAGETGFAASSFCRSRSMFTCFSVSSWIRVIFSVSPGSVLIVIE
jgi:hypothetical protein